MVIVKPGGTGNPKLLISASPAPFPPRRSRIPVLPSARPSPNSYTNFSGNPFPLVSATFGDVITYSSDKKVRTKHCTTDIDSGIHKQRIFIFALSYAVLLNCTERFRFHLSLFLTGLTSVIPL